MRTRSPYKTSGERMRMQSFGTRKTQSEGKYVFLAGARMDAAPHVEVCKHSHKYHKLVNRLGNVGTCLSIISRLSTPVVFSREFVLVFLARTSNYFVFWFVPCVACIAYVKAKRSSAAARKPFSLWLGSLCASICNTTYNQDR